VPLSSMVLTRTKAIASYNWCVGDLYADSLGGILDMLQFSELREKDNAVGLVDHQYINSSRAA